MPFERALMINNSITTETAVIPNTQASNNNAAVTNKLVVCICTLRYPTLEVADSLYSIQSKENDISKPLFAMLN